MKETEDQSGQRSEQYLPEDKLIRYVSRAQAQLDKLRTEGGAHRTVHLFAGPEGGPVTETVLQRITEAMHLSDLRTTAEMQSGPGDDPEVVGVFEHKMDNGVILRLSRIRDQDGSVFIELDALRP